GWEFRPALADGAPEAVGGEEINGKITSKVWRVNLKEGLEWNYADAVKSLPGFADFDHVLDANDFYWTYREALTRNLFRAISGGGDFVSEVVGAEAFAQKAAQAIEDGEIDAEELAELDTLWASVGIKLIDDHTLEFTM